MINTDEEIVIRLDKFNLVLITMGSAIFVITGIVMIVVPVEKGYIAAILAIVTFGVFFCFGMFKIFDRSPGLVINSSGILDNSSGLSVGLIDWDDIEGFSERKMHSQRILTVHVRNPDKYLKRGNFLQRKANRANLRMAGSPIQISAITIRTDFDALNRICQSYLDRYGQA